MLERSALNSTDELLSRVRSVTSSASWTTSMPVDQLQTYLAQARRSTRIQTFPTTPASDQVLIQARFNTDSTGMQILEGKAWHVLSERGKRLMKNLPDIKIQHRSRPAGLMSNKLQQNEYLRRVRNAAANMDVLTSISLPTSTAEELNSIKRDAITPRLKVDMDHIKKYIKEHEKSSIAPGLKWGALPEDRGFWTAMYNEIVPQFKENAFSGKSFDIPFNIGSRQRADQQVYRDQVDYDLAVTRTRVVMFHPALSSIYAFLPDKKGFYNEVLTESMDVMDITDHVITPLTHGGEVYGEAANALKDGDLSVISLGDDLNIYNKGKQFAFDGSNWETQVGTILGEPFHGSKTYFGGMYHVPSGVYDTSLDDTLATLWVYSQNRDDLLAGKEFPNIMERSAEDEKVNFMLGLAYDEDPDYPTLCGLKLTQDRSDIGQILPMGRTLELSNKYREDEAERWELAYYGTTPDGGSLLDFLTEISVDDFRGGMVVDEVTKERRD
jgi:hypothetical protein